MKRIAISFVGTMTMCFFFLSCQKSSLGGYDNGSWLKGDCQVAEYHYGIYDLINPEAMPYLFKKTFDPSGKLVREIDCYFWSEESPHEITTPQFHHTLVVEQKGYMIYFFNKNNLKNRSSDTVASVKLNKDGRPQQCIANAELISPRISFGLDSMVTEEYIYRDNRVFAVKSKFLRTGSFPGMHPSIMIDSLYYDFYGNLLSFGLNNYQYDYSRKADHQFYSMDYMKGNWPFYLLQYLGFFPEVTSPVNIRTNLIADESLNGPLLNHVFDAEGKLVSYRLGSADGISIDVIWNCKK
jgi:hypothetical protein